MSPIPHPAILKKEGDPDFWVTLQRYASNDYETVGLMFVDGKFYCDVIEDEGRDQKVAGETRIPAGEYDLILEHSPKFSVPERYGHPMLTVGGVPNFTGIRIHRGRTEKDTDGCPLVGYGIMRVLEFPSTLLESKLAYERFYQAVSTRLLAGEKAKIRITDEA